MRLAGSSRIPTDTVTDMSITKECFGKLPSGETASLYTLKNRNGMTVKITDFGGAIVSLMTPDREGRFTDIVCGYDNLSDYLRAAGYQGALIGRFGNRINKGKFTLDGVEYSLCVNNGNHHLHGGGEGFSHKLWDSLAIDGDEPQLVLSYLSPDMEEGYPGNLSTKVTYTLTEDNAISIHYEAQTDKKTILNLTNHAYFNLNGYAGGNIGSHLLRIDADTYLPTDNEVIPTGEIKSVEGTPFDFRVEKPIGRDIDLDDVDLKYGGGYDHCLNFCGGETKEIQPRAVLYSPDSGREMQILTNLPSIQIYTANFMNDEIPFKGGYPQIPRNAVALETQKMPDSINRDNFTNVILDVGEKYDYTTVYKFTVR